VRSHNKVRTFVKNKVRNYNLHEKERCTKTANLS